ncbi:hypothetical protein [Salmonella phage SD-12_S18]|nr:hypothetical protein [Salmonella phage SD-12_S18]
MRRKSGRGLASSCPTVIRSHDTTRSAWYRPK